jgi:hypothetical protein
VIRYLPSVSASPARASASSRRPESAASACPRRLPSHLVVAPASHSPRLSFSPAASNSSLHPRLSSLRPRYLSRPNHPYPFISTTGRTIHIHPSSPPAAARHQNRSPDNTTPPHAAPPIHSPRRRPGPRSRGLQHLRLCRLGFGTLEARRRQGGLLLPTGELRARRRPR